MSKIEGPLPATGPLHSRWRASADRCVTLNFGSRLNSRDTNGEIRAYARLAVNLDVSSVGANDRFD